MSSVNYNRTEKLRFWCQKVLPIVYDDSLSYYELLNKVVVYLNSTIEDVQSVIDEITSLEQSVGNKIDKSQKGVANGVATLGSNGKVPLSQLPDVSTGVQSISVNGVPVPADSNKNVNIVVMTNSVSNLVNYYLKTETYNKSEVNTLIDNVKNSRFEVVAQLPTSDIQTNVIYLVPKVDGEVQNGYDEYINLDGTTSGWELIGSTDIDLSGYVTDSELATALTSYVTTQALNATLADYVSNSALATALSGYVQISMFNALSGVVSGQGTRLTQAESDIDAGVKLLGDTVGWTGKNKFPNKTNTVGANTYTVDSDGYVSTTVESDGRTWSYANSNIKFTLKRGTYKIRGYEKTASTSGYTGFHILDDSDNELLAVSNWNSFMTTALTLTLTEDTNIGVEYKLGNGEFAFMIADASVYDLSPTFVPYHATVEEEIQSNISLLSDTVGWTGKNQLNSDNYQVYNVGDNSNVTATPYYNSEGHIEKIRINGGVGSSGYAQVQFSQRGSNTGAVLKQKDYIFSIGNDLPTGCRLQAGYTNPTTESYTPVLDATSDGVLFTSPTNTQKWTIQITIGTNTTLTDYDVYPMLSDPEKYAISPIFEPYHESVAEMLTPKLLTSANDLDDIKTGGDYYWTQSYPTHSPENNTFGALRVMPCGEVIHQMVIRGAGNSASIYIRRFQETWGSWYKFSGTVVS